MATRKKKATTRRATARSRVEHPTRSFPAKLQKLVDDVVEARSPLAILCCGSWPRFPDDATIGNAMANYWALRILNNDATKAEVEGIRTIPASDLIALKHVMLPILGEAEDRFHASLLSGRRSRARAKPSGVRPKFRGRRDPDRAGIDSGGRTTASGWRSRS